MHIFAALFWLCLGTPRAIVAARPRWPELCQRWVASHAENVTRPGSLGSLGSLGIQAAASTAPFANFSVPNHGKDIGKPDKWDKWNVYHLSTGDIVANSCYLMF